jgi:hypothetical protein
LARHVGATNTSGQPGKKGLVRHLAKLVASLAASLLILPGIRAFSGDRIVDRVTIETKGGPIAAFSAEQAFGASIDGAGQSEIAPIFAPINVAAMRSEGFTEMSYRLRTELANEAWHWSPDGRWSDPAHQQGYWTSDDRADSDQLVTFGYRLPRRGNTIDQANDDGYSRLDDGDPESFWKSNPYLDSTFSGEREGQPQWVVIELPQSTPIDAIHILWKQPYARQYRVQYWVGDHEWGGRWETFPQGEINKGKGGSALLHLARAPVQARFVRILLLKSSNSAATTSTDLRDKLGYAIGEIYLGVTTSSGFEDALLHGADRHGQTIMHVSSTDPWHRARDLDPNTEQPSLSALAKAGLIGRHLMVPVGILYDTPDNALAELRYLRRRNIPVDGVELGEEPDGQMMSARDYGSLYLEFARQLRAAFPGLVIGGPSLQDGIADTWLDPDPDESWTSQFIAYLRSRGALDELGFFSFEHFPFDDMCGPIEEKLLDRSSRTEAVFRRLDADGVPRSIPWIVSEYGFSAFAGQAMVEMPSAVLHADLVADFLKHGGARTYLYGYSPDRPIDGEKPCAGRGNMMLWEADTERNARWAMPTYYTARMLASEWASPGGGKNLLFPAATMATDAQGRALATAYPLLRPDGLWSVLLVNRSPREIETYLYFANAQVPPHPALNVFRYSPKQYAWDKVEARPSRDLPPEHMKLSGWSSRLRLPGLSLTIVRGEGPSVGTAGQLASAPPPTRELASR